MTSRLAGRRDIRADHGEKRWRSAESGSAGTPGAGCHTVPPGGSSIAPSPSAARGCRPCRRESKECAGQRDSEETDSVRSRKGRHRATANAEIVSDYQVIGVNGRDRDAVLPGSYDRIRAVRGEILPSASAIVGAEELAPRP